MHNPNYSPNAFETNHYSLVQKQASQDENDYVKSLSNQLYDGIKNTEEPSNYSKLHHNPDPELQPSEYDHTNFPPHNYSEIRSPNENYSQIQLHDNSYSELKPQGHYYSSVSPSYSNIQSPRSDGSKPKTST